MKPRSRVAFLRGFLLEFFEKQLTHHNITPRRYHHFRAALERRELLLRASRQLFDSSPHPTRLENFGEAQLVELREIDGPDFPFLFVAPPAVKFRRNPLGCFLGHRFAPPIERALRYNLAHLLEPYGIRLHWAGQDLAARELFDQIVAAIARADFCIFDTLGTKDRPNVFIEIGVAYALRKPTIVCEYTGRKRKNLSRVPPTDRVPSDLQGLLRVQYKSYEDLCRQLYFGLPSFLSRHRLLSGPPVKRSAAIR